MAAYMKFELHEYKNGIVYLRSKFVPTAGNDYTSIVSSQLLFTSRQVRLF